MYYLLLTKHLTTCTCSLSLVLLPRSTHVTRGRALTKSLSYNDSSASLGSSLSPNPLIKAQHGAGDVKSGATKARHQAIPSAERL